MAVRPVPGVEPTAVGRSRSAAMLLVALGMVCLPLAAPAQSTVKELPRDPGAQAPVLVSPLQAERDRLGLAIAANDKPKVADWIGSGRGLDFNFNDEQPRNRSGQSPLTLAVISAKFDIVQMLIAAGADVRRKDGFGQAPVHVAKSADMLALLIKAGADPNAQDAQGGTAALLALEAGNVPLLDLILASGGRLAARPKGGDLFTRVIDLKKPGLIPVLLERGVTPRSPPTQALWPLIDSGDVDNVRRLIRAGADPNARSDREGLLARALFRKQWEIAELLLDAGADPHLPDSPLCVQNGALCESTQVIRFATFDPPMLARLKASGLSLDTVAADGNTALTALIVEQPMAIRAVSAAGTMQSSAVNAVTGEQVSRTESTGSTGSTGAVREIPAPDNGARVRALLAAGADPNKKLRDLTPLMVAVGLGDDRPRRGVGAGPVAPVAIGVGRLGPLRREIIDALLAAGGRIAYDAPVAPAQAGEPQSYRSLSSPGQNDFNVLSGMRVGPLGWAVLRGRDDIALRLLQRDHRMDAADRNLPYFAAATQAWELLLAVLPYAKDVNTADRAQVTPLLLAAAAGRADAVRALIAAGADVNARSVRDWPPLAERNLREEFLAGLAGHSASKPPLVGGFTALRVARAVGNTELVRLLVEAGGKE